jgi:16S rRNA (adenine1518-N6/adenine1519-N6)-dimethyltransferase
MKQLKELQERGIRLKQSLGQNLLIDQNLCVKLVAAADLQGGDPVLEIGPGAGALTVHLLAAGARVLAVEIDSRILPVLEDQFHGMPGFTLEQGDILKIPRERIESFAGGERIKLVSNLPFYSSTQILFRLAEWRDIFSIAVIILQRELADRMLSDPGTKEYGILSVRMQAVAEMHQLFTLPASVFFPRPKIDARAVLMDFRRPAMPADLNEKDFARCVRAAFGQRRKMLPNALGAAYGTENARRALIECGIDPTTRAERLGVAEFFELTRAIKKVSNPKISDLPLPPKVG